mmetsp:Transcript_33795/g.65295  ORF Transcript_33795/g.65295 Transcript_33795/m.65295 type:complete len:84 (-) Transcript_33795:216-467(-)
MCRYSSLESCFAELRLRFLGRALIDRHEQSREDGRHETIFQVATHVQCRVKMHTGAGCNVFHLKQSMHIQQPPNETRGGAASA